MDPIGFAFENYDAIGAWRDKDGGFAIDASGELPDGQSFQGPAELKAILKDKKDQFSRCLTEKVLTYALGRGLEYYDRCAVDEIMEALEQGRIPVFDSDYWGDQERTIPEANHARGPAMSDGLRISRRTMLRGVGTAVALPFLDAMMPRSLAAAGATAGRRAAWPSSTCPTAPSWPTGRRRPRAPASSSPPSSSRWLRSGTNCWCSAA